MAIAVEPAGRRLAESLRGRISEAAPDHANVVVESLVEAIKTTKRVKGHCDKCDAWVSVSVQDATAATNAIKLLIEQTEGRPGVADQDEAQALTIVRTVAHTLDPQHALTLMDRALETLGDSAPAPLHTLRQELLSSLPHAHAHEA